MHPRIMGLETEHGFVAKFPEVQQALDQAPFAKLLFLPSRSQVSSNGRYLANGARFYIDVGHHPEYSTPECASLADLVAADQAGQRLVEIAGLMAEERYWQANGRRIRFDLYRNNVDHHGNMYGCHENYLLQRDNADFSRIADAMVPFLVARQILVGAGGVHVTAGGPRFCFSQRALHLRETVTSNSLRDRGLINTRDEPLAAEGRFRRLHVVAGDANMSETSTFLRSVPPTWSCVLLKQGRSTSPTSPSRTRLLPSRPSAGTSPGRPRSHWRTAGTPPRPKCSPGTPIASTEFSTVRGPTPHRHE